MTPSPVSLVPLSIYLVQRNKWVGWGSALFAAAYHGYVDLCDLLIKKGASVTLTDAVSPPGRQAGRLLTVGCGLMGRACGCVRASSPESRHVHCVGGLTPKTLTPSIATSTLSLTLMNICFVVMCAARLHALALGVPRRPGGGRGCCAPAQGHSGAAARQPCAR